MFASRQKEVPLDQLAAEMKQVIESTGRKEMVLDIGQGRALGRHDRDPRRRQGQRRPQYHQQPADGGSRTQQASTGSRLRQSSHSHRFIFCSSTTNS